MQNNNSQTMFYGNVTFLEGEQVQLESRLLDFPSVFGLSIALLKRRFLNLFLPIFGWGLLPIIPFLFAVGYIISILATNPEFAATGNLPPTQIMSVIGSSILAILVLIIGAFFSGWITTKSNFMLNNSTSRLWDSNNLIGKFFIIIAVNIVFSLAVFVLGLPFSFAQNIEYIGFFFGIISLLISLVTTFLQIWLNYAMYQYLFEDSGVESSIRNFMNSFKTYWKGDLARNLLFVIASFFAVLIPIIIFGLVVFGTVFVGIGNVNSGYTANPGLLIPLGVATILLLVFLSIFGMFASCFSYICYYNLRMLQLNNFELIEQR
jgi:hypothetical protein